MMHVRHHGPADPLPGWLPGRLQGRPDTRMTPATTAPEDGIEDRWAQRLWLWRCSGNAGPTGRMPWLSRLRMVREGMRHFDAVRPYRAAPPESALGLALKARPQLMEIILRPYHTAEWGTERRLAMLRDHYMQVARLGWPDLLRPDAALRIAPLDRLHPGLRLVLDQPAWFTCEGPLVLNLFLGEDRLYSLAFALQDSGGRTAASVAAIQGRALPGVTALYRQLTRSSHGLRPRDLLIELFQAWCRAAGVERIVLVADTHRHHRHAYYGDAQRALPTNYDLIWADRGAWRIAAGQYELPLRPRRRTAAEIPPRKRALYARRYAELDAICAAIETDIGARCRGRTRVEIACVS